jgi:hypothetical protein
MPTYQFKNNDTNEIEEHRMSYTVLDQFKVDNPNLEIYICAENIPILSDGIRMNVPGIGKSHMAFETGVIQRIQESVPGNTVKAGHKTSRPREW